MFENLTEKFQRVFKTLRGEAKLTEENMAEALREIRLALLEADVHFQVVKQLLDNIRTKCHGQEVWTSFSPASFIFLLLLCFLGGILIAFSLFLLRRQVAMSASVGISGIVIAVLAPACSACAFGLVGWLGISSILVFLPLHGMEFSILGVIVVLISLFYLSRKINTLVCEVKK